MPVKMARDLDHIQRYSTISGLQKSQSDTPSQILRLSTLSRVTFWLLMSKKYDGNSQGHWHAAAGHGPELRLELRYLHDQQQSLAPTNPDPTSGGSISIDNPRLNDRAGALGPPGPGVTANARAITVDAREVI
jgi:hypothetical protein